MKVLKAMFRLQNVDNLTVLEFKAHDESVDCLTFRFHGSKS